MSVIIKVFYPADTVFKMVLSLLKPVIKEWNKANETKDKFERVYIKTTNMERQA